MSRGYWSTHDYERRSVLEIDSFVGWEYLVDLVDRCRSDRDKALVSTLQPPEYLIVKGMPVYKRYRKVGEYTDEQGNVKWKTRREHAYRTFPIRLDEPLVSYMTDWIRHLRFEHEKLFKITRIRAYQILRKLDPNIYSHWFRSQRASQLAVEYGFQIHDLLEFFNWTSIKMAAHYSHMGWKTLGEKMRRLR